MVARTESRRRERGTTLFAYSCKRILRIVPTLLIIVTAIFLLVHMIPGDPAAQVLGDDATMEDLKTMREHMGLNKPLHKQYLSFLGGLLQGDLGTSFMTRRPVLEDALQRFQRTMILAGSSLIFASTFGILLGVPAGARPYSVTSAVTMFLAMVGVAAPSFWLGFILMLVFSLWLQILPSAGYGTIQHLILPTITLGTWSLGVIARMTRACVADIINSDHVRTARAKGLSESVVLMKHTLRNAMIPIITTIGLRFGYMLSGAVATETVFNWPGLGTFIVEAIKARDFPSVQAAILLFSICFLLVNLAVDLAYGLIDPRIKY